MFIPVYRLVLVEYTAAFIGPSLNRKQRPETFKRRPKSLISKSYQSKILQIHFYIKRRYISCYRPIMNGKGFRLHYDIQWTCSLTLNTQDRMVQLMKKKTRLYSLFFGSGFGNQGNFRYRTYRPNIFSSCSFLNSR